MRDPFGRYHEESEEPDPFGRFHDLPALIAEQVPMLDGAVHVAIRSQTALVSLILADTPTHKAPKLIFTQAVNDLIDLLAEIQSGRGRAAIRTSRALIEHAINLHTVTVDLQQAQRYLEHLDLGKALMLELEIGADLLDRRSKSQYRHSLKRVGRGARQRFEQARANWGSGFSRGWSNQSLATRAARYDLDHLYEYYRLTSLVTHGSAGGILGSIRDHHEGEISTYRTGQSLELAPVALHIGIVAYMDALTALAGLREDLDVEDYMLGVGVLVNVWPEYYKALTRIDSKIWPKKPGLPPQAVFAISRSGRRRWYLHLPWASVLMPAEPPDLETGPFARLEEIVREVMSDPDRYFIPGTTWFTLGFFGVPLKLADSGSPVPDTAILYRPEDLPEGWSYRLA
ncbi:DUF5677 domain-containing protein [Kribbella jiaozuonensis]|uniref:Uncharacterized protein n=1 Tax=Kribbella jiaozuonensis TaxID=2575441 RepID=A0A4U3M6E4_9ACTN|nr:DUF5677 domain-containing protein [Kribbella jiaozuonensis]TKK83006.1 hypothetical protein FDA38_09790 [Kribbella jiaozuonensis]